MLKGFIFVKRYDSEMLQRILIAKENLEKRGDLRLKGVHESFHKRSRIGQLFYKENYEMALRWENLYTADRIEECDDLRDAINLGDVYISIKNAQQLRIL